MQVFVFEASERKSNFDKPMLVNANNDNHSLRRELRP